MSNAKYIVTLEMEEFEEFGAGTDFLQPAHSSSGGSWHIPRAKLMAAGAKIVRRFERNDVVRMDDGRIALVMDANRGGVIVAYVTDKGTAREAVVSPENLALMRVVGQVETNGGDLG